MKLDRRPQGRLWMQKKRWHLTCAPHIAMALKRIFPRVELDKQQFIFRHSPEAAWNLLWFAARYPLDVVDPDKLERAAREYEAIVTELDAIDSPSYQGRPIPLAFPLRKYQARSVDLFTRTGQLLVADDLGLGKTATALGTLTAQESLPAAVICYSHLQLQWAREVRKFLPGAFAHIIRTREMYDPCDHSVVNRSDAHGRFILIDGIRHTTEEHLLWCQAAGVSQHKRGRVKTRYPDVLILTYSKLADWADYLGTAVRTVAWDEVQELRNNDSNKYKAAKRLANNVPRQLGLSATPVYNYGGETFNVFDVLSPGRLGEWSEFCREWTTGEASERGKVSVKDPAALGAYLRSEHLMVRHTRSEVGRELPAVSRYTQLVGCNEGDLEKVSAPAAELAKIILGEAKARLKGIDLMQAGSEFINLLRKATGIAKAPSVAAFVKLLLENDEPIILSGWHRSVYEIWMDLLKEHKPELYTGSESAAQKDRARARFLDGSTNLLILSNRSGAGLDGLQARCKTAVIGELDWSPGPHKQFIGRIHRDGQQQPVFAYFLFCNSGSDPVIMDVLGLKDQQQRGVVDPWAPDAPELADTAAMNRAHLLARAYLAKYGAA